MKNVLRGGVVALAAIAAVLVVGTAWAGTSAEAKKIVTFKGKYAGTAVVKVTDNVADIAATGPGLGTLIGKSKVTGKGKGDASDAAVRAVRGHRRHRRTRRAARSSSR